MEWSSIEWCDNGLGCDPLRVDDTFIGKRYRHIDWVIVGGESGHHARPCQVDWIGEIVTDCHIAKVPCFVKQLGAEPRGFATFDRKNNLIITDKKGGNPEEWPHCFRVREIPE